MPNIHIPAEEIAFTLQLDIVTSKPCVLLFKGYDPTKHNTAYFNRKFGTPQKPFFGEKRFEFPLPISPRKLKIKVANGLEPNREDVIEVKRIKAVPLKKANTILYPDEDVYKFVEFAKWFSKKCGYLPQRTYVSGKPENFIIKYTNYIMTRDNKRVIDTPARVSRVTGGIEANRKKFMRYTIPIRMMILLHERMHYEKNTRDEQVADWMAVNIYLKMGFPKTEALYAVANILTDTKANRKRVRAMMNHIYNYNN